MLTRFVALATSFLLALYAPFRWSDTSYKRRGRRHSRSDRGDVPGWVLITVMTAALVVALWALAGEAFTNFFTDSMNKVRNAG